MNVLVGLSVGAAVAVAFYYGAREMEQVKETIHTSIAISLLGGVICAAVGFFASGFLLEMMDTPENIIGLAKVYLKIYFLEMCIRDRHGDHCNDILPLRYHGCALRHAARDGRIYASYGCLHDRFLPAACGLDLYDICSGSYTSGTVSVLSGDLDRDGGSAFYLLSVCEKESDTAGDERKRGRMKVKIDIRHT